MKRIIAAAVLLLSICSLSQARPVAEKDSLYYNGSQRFYYLYIPEVLNPAKPLVMMLHGYGGNADGYCPVMLETAEREGFAVCIPQGLPDNTGKNCWNVGYPMQRDLKRDDASYVCTLAQYIAESRHLNTRNMFLTGMSNGGEMCYTIAYRKPATFSAIASIAGLIMHEMYKGEKPRGQVPFMEVHGTADKTSMWEGDLSGTGKYGNYISVPSAIAMMSSMNRCSQVETEELPLKAADSNKVTLYRHIGGDPAWEGGPDTEVWLYKIDGGKHNWGLADLDTCDKVWEFFKKYLRP